MMVNMKSLLFQWSSRSTLKNCITLNSILVISFSSKMLPVDFYVQLALFVAHQASILPLLSLLAEPHFSFYSSGKWPWFRSNSLKLSFLPLELSASVWCSSSLQDKARPLLKDFWEGYPLLKETQGEKNSYSSCINSHCDTTAAGGILW